MELYFIFGSYVESHSPSPQRLGWGPDFAVLTNTVGDFSGSKAWKVGPLAGFLSVYPLVSQNYFLEISFLASNLSLHFLNSVF